MPNSYVIDCEVYPNYFLLSAQNLADNSLLHFERSPYHDIDRVALKSFLSDTLTISFNGLAYDLPIIAGVIKGYSNEQIKKLSDRLVQSEEPSWLICNDIGLVVPRTWDHIDIINVAPGVAGLKLYGGRLHQQKLQDLPISIDTVLTRSQMDEVKRYCVNDLDTTALLYRALEKQVGLRAKMSKQYGMDLRSKSDAQIAETVIKSELEAITCKKYYAPKVEQSSFRYVDPEIISFETKQLKDVFEKILKTEFTLGGNGAVKIPDWLKDIRIKIGQSEYRMGIGGLHSCEKSQYIRATDNTIICDLDVASYYPSIILQQRLAPKSLGDPFLRVYQSIVERRLASKKRVQEITKEIAKLEDKLAKLTV